MSSIIELRRVLPTILILCGLGASAIALQAAILPLAGNAGPAMVMMKQSIAPRALPPGVAILEWDGTFARLSNVDAEAARALYSDGALLVFPVRGGGCLSLRR